MTKDTTSSQSTSFARRYGFIFALVLVAFFAGLLLREPVVQTMHAWIPGNQVSGAEVLGAGYDDCRITDTYADTSYKVWALRCGENRFVSWKVNYRDPALEPMSEIHAIGENGFAELERFKGRLDILKADNSDMAAGLLRTDVPASYTKPDYDSIIRLSKTDDGRYLGHEIYLHELYGSVWTADILVDSNGQIDSVTIWYNSKEGYEKAYHAGNGWEWQR